MWYDSVFIDYSNCLYMIWPKVLSVCVVCVCQGHALYMFHPDAQLIWLINRTPFNQLAVGLINRPSGCSACSAMCPVDRRDGQLVNQPSCWPRNCLLCIIHCYLLWFIFSLYPEANAPPRNHFLCCMVVTMHMHEVCIQTGFKHWFDRYTAKTRLVSHITTIYNKQ